MTINVTPFQMREIILLHWEFYGVAEDRSTEYDERLRAIGVPVPIREKIKYKVVRR